MALARNASMVAAALAVASALCLGLAPSAHAVTSAQIVSVINVERQANGLPPVREDPALSAGCAGYDNYRRLNGSVQDAFTPGDENPSKPGYTTAGARASRNSLLNAGDRPEDSWASGDVFNDAPGHLFQLMSPDLTTIGADELDVNLGSPFGTAYISCLDTRSAPYRALPRRLRVYSYRGPTGSVPGFQPIYREGQRGVGPLIFVYYQAPKRATVTLLSLKLRHASGPPTDPRYIFLAGGLRDGRRRAGAKSSRRKTGFFFGREPGVIFAYGVPKPGDKVVFVVKITFQDGAVLREPSVIPLNPAPQ